MRPSGCPTKRPWRTPAPCTAQRASTAVDGVAMPKVGSSVLLREIAAQSCTDFAQRDRFRREAIALIAHEDLIDPAYSYRIVPLDEPPRDCLHVGGEVLHAMRLVPDSGELTAVAAAVCTLGVPLERRTTELFAERRPSLALALDTVGNELLFALSRRLQDRILAEARKLQLSAAGELRAGDPGLPLAAQAAVLGLRGGGPPDVTRGARPRARRLAAADTIDVTVSRSQLLSPLKSTSMILGIGIDLPPALWSRSAACPWSSKGRVAGR